jgi:hypothetical protein
VGHDIRREGALDYNRMRTQALIVGDTVLTLSKLPEETIAGDHITERTLADAGAPRC